MIEDEAVLNELQDRLGWLETHAVQREYGIITDTSPLTVRVGSQDTLIEDVARNADYTPTVNDRVILLRAGSDWIVWGQVTV